MKIGEKDVKKKQFSMIVFFGRVLLQNN